MTVAPPVLRTHLTPSIALPASIPPSMDDVQEELNAAVLQAKKRCVEMRQKGQLGETSDDVHVKRYTYAVTVLRKDRGATRGSSRRSRSLTRIYVEEKHERSKSAVPSLSNVGRKEFVERHDEGDRVRLEWHETVEGVPHELMEADEAEVRALEEKLPYNMTEWEHEHALQHTDNTYQLRVGDHLYGYSRAEDLSIDLPDKIHYFFHGTHLKSFHSSLQNLDLTYSSLPLAVESTSHRSSLSSLNGYGYGFRHVDTSTTARDLALHSTEHSTERIGLGRRSPLDAHRVRDVSELRVESPSPLEASTYRHVIPPTSELSRYQAAAIHRRTDSARSEAELWTRYQHTPIRSPYMGSSGTHFEFASPVGSTTRSLLSQLNASAEVEEQLREKRERKFTYDMSERASRRDSIASSVYEHIPIKSHSRSVSPYNASAHTDVRLSNYQESSLSSHRDSIRSVYEHIPISGHQNVHRSIVHESSFEAPARLATTHRESIQSMNEHHPITSSVHHDYVAQSSISEVPPSPTVIDSAATSRRESVQTVYEHIPITGHQNVHRSLVHESFETPARMTTFGRESIQSMYEHHPITSAPRQDYVAQSSITEVSSTPVIVDSAATSRMESVQSVYEHIPITGSTAVYSQSSYTPAVQTIHSEVTNNEHSFDDAYANRHGAFSGIASESVRVVETVTPIRSVDFAESRHSVVEASSPVVYHHIPLSSTVHNVARQAEDVHVSRVEERLVETRREAPVIVNSEMAPIPIVRDIRVSNEMSLEEYKKNVAPYLVRSNSDHKVERVSTETIEYQKEMMDRINTNMFDEGLLEVVGLSRAPSRQSEISEVEHMEAMLERSSHLEQIPITETAHVAESAAASAESHVEQVESRREASAEASTIHEAQAEENVEAVSHSELHEVVSSRDDALPDFAAVYQPIPIRTTREVADAVPEQRVEEVVSTHEETVHVEAEEEEAHEQAAEIDDWIEIAEEEVEEAVKEAFAEEKRESKESQEELRIIDLSKSPVKKEGSTDGEVEETEEVQEEAEEVTVIEEHVVAAGQHDVEEVVEVHEEQSQSAQEQSDEQHDVVEDVAVVDEHVESAEEQEVVKGEEVHEEQSHSVVETSEEQHNEVEEVAVVEEHSEESEQDEEIEEATEVDTVESQVADDIEIEEEIIHEEEHHDEEETAYHVDHVEEAEEVDQDEEIDVHAVEEIHEEAAYASEEQAEEVLQQKEQAEEDVEEEVQELVEEVLQHSELTHEPLELHHEHDIVEEDHHDEEHETVHEHEEVEDDQLHSDEGALGESKTLEHHVSNLNIDIVPEDDLQREVEYVLSHDEAPTLRMEREERKTEISTAELRLRSSSSEQDEGGKKKDKKRKLLKKSKKRPSIEASPATSDADPDNMKNILKGLMQESDEAFESMEHEIQQQEEDMHHAELVEVIEEEQAHEVASENVERAASADQHHEIAEEAVHLEFTESANDEAAVHSESAKHHDVLVHEEFGSSQLEKSSSHLTQSSQFESLYAEPPSIVSEDPPSLFAPSRIFAERFVEDLARVEDVLKESQMYLESQKKKNEVIYDNVHEDVIYDEVAREHHQSGTPPSTPANAGEEHPLAAPPGDENHYAVTKIVSSDNSALYRDDEHIYEEIDDRHVIESSPYHQVIALDKPDTHEHVIQSSHYDQVYTATTTTSDIHHNNNKSAEASYASIHKERNFSNDYYDESPYAAPAEETKDLSNHYETPILHQPRKIDAAYVEGQRETVVTSADSIRSLRERFEHSKSEERRERMSPPKRKDFGGDALSGDENGNVEAEEEKKKVLVAETSTNVVEREPVPYSRSSTMGARTIHREVVRTVSPSLSRSDLDDGSILTSPTVIVGNDRKTELEDRAYHKNHYEDVVGVAAAAGRRVDADVEVARTTLAIRRMSKNNQWTEEELEEMAARKSIKLDEVLPPNSPFVRLNSTSPSATTTTALKFNLEGPKKEPRKDHPPKHVDVVKAHAKEVVQAPKNIPPPLDLTSTLYRDSEEALLHSSYADEAGLRRVEPTPPVPPTPDTPAIQYYKGYVKDACKKFEGPEQTAVHTTVNSIKLQRTRSPATRRTKLPANNNNNNNNNNAQEAEKPALVKVEKREEEVVTLRNAGQKSTDKDNADVEVTSTERESRRSEFQSRRKSVTEMSRSYEEMIRSRSSSRNNSPQGRKHDVPSIDRVHDHMGETTVSYPSSVESSANKRTIHRSIMTLVGENASSVGQFNVRDSAVYSAVDELDRQTGHRLAEEEAELPAHISGGVRRSTTQDLREAVHEMDGASPKDLHPAPVISIRSSPSLDDKVIVRPKPAPRSEPIYEVPPPPQPKKEQQKADKYYFPIYERAVVRPEAVVTVEEARAEVEPQPTSGSSSESAVTVVERELLDDEPVLLQRNGSGRRSWPVKVYENTVRLSSQKLKMPDVDFVTSNGHVVNGQDKMNGEESAVLRDWDPRLLVKALYEVSYEPRVETKRDRFVNMEGHVDVPSDETNTLAELEREWKQQYIRTKEGRLQIFVTHCAHEAPAEEIVLNGADVKANRDERTLFIHGGRENIKLLIRVPSPVFDKWRQAILSHAASSQIDAYVKPIHKALQHPKQRVMVVELGSCSIRGGLMTSQPTLPQSFFPAIAIKTDSGRIVVGEDAYAPQVRHAGEFVRPIQANDPSLERYSMDREVVKACIEKVIRDLHVDPSQYKVLLSIPQNIPTVLIGELLAIALQDLHFQGAAVTRQPSLILYAYDVTTGVVVDIGDRLNIVPVIDGYVVESAICSIPYGATQVREALRGDLCSSNNGLYSFQSPIEKLILRYVMEQTSYVPEDYAKETSNQDVNISLDEFNPTPNMPTKFNIDSSRFTCTEGLFRPKKWGLDTKGLHQLIHEAVQMSPIDSRRTLYRNIYLAGGASLLPGLAEKLEHELSNIVPNSIHTQVHISPWRYNAAYLGAQIVASGATFEDSCVTAENLPKYLVNLSASPL